MISTRACTYSGNLSTAEVIILPPGHPESWGKTADLELYPTIAQIENTALEPCHMQYRGEQVKDIELVSEVYRITTEDGYYYARATTRLAVHPDSVNTVREYFDYPTIAPRKVVKLDDGRIGVVNCIEPSPMIVNGKREDIDRAYVVGLSNEFADWVVLNQIAKVLGEAVNATGAAFTA